MAAGRPLSSCKVPNCQEKFQGFSGTHVGFFLFLMLFSFFMFTRTKTTGKATFLAVDLGATSGRTILATYDGGRVAMKEITHSGPRTS